MRSLQKTTSMLTAALLLSTPFAHAQRAPVPPPHHDHAVPVRPVWNVEITVTDAADSTRPLLSQQLLTTDRRLSRLDYQGNQDGIRRQTDLEVSAVDDGTVELRLDYRESYATDRIQWASTFVVHPGTPSVQSARFGDVLRIIHVLVR